MSIHSPVPDYRAVIRAVARRDKARTVVDGMTAANDLGLTTAVPARIEVLVDARRRLEPRASPNGSRRFVARYRRGPEMQGGGLWSDAGVVEHYVEERKGPTTHGSHAPGVPLLGW